MKLYRDFLWTRRNMLGPGCTWGSPEEGTTHQGAPGGPGAPWWVVPTSGAPPGPPLCSINTQIFLTPQGSRRNIHPAAQSPEPLDPIQTPSRMGFTTSIGECSMMREQFFVDLRVRSQQLDGFLSLAEFSIQWSLGDPYDVILFTVCMLRSDEL